MTLGSELLAAASNKFPKSNAPIPGVVEEDKIQLQQLKYKM